MPGANWTKPVIYKQAAWLLLILSAVCNEFSIPWLQGMGWLPAWPRTTTHGLDLQVYLPRVVGVILLSTGLIMLIARRGLGWLLGHSVAFNLWCLTLGIALMLVVNPIGAGQHMLLRVLLLLVVLFFLVNCLYLAAVVRTQMHAAYRNLLLMGFTLLFLFVALEGVFMWIAKPHHQNDALSSRIWFARHWRMNELGYRDRPIGEDTTGRRVLLIGDSFGSGHGVADEEDRMGEQLEQHLGEGWRVYNAAYPGLDTQKELLSLAFYPVKPDYVVLQWYPNDVEAAALEGGYRLPTGEAYPGLGWVSRWVVEHSYVLNYLYWLRPKDGRIESYSKFTERVFKDTKVMDIHRRDLERIHTWCEVRHVPLVVVLFPFMGMAEESRYTTAPVRAHFESVGVPVVDVGDVVKGKPVKLLVASSSDGHASAVVHRMVGEELAKVFESRGWK